MSAIKTVKIGHFDLKFYKTSVVYGSVNMYFARDIDGGDIEKVTKFARRLFKEGEERAREKTEQAWTAFRDSFRP